MVTHKILFLPYEIEIEVPNKHTIIRSAVEAGVHINASCGGEGICGKCRVKIEKGHVKGGVSEKINKSDIKNNFKLACKSKVTEDLVVLIPLESIIDFKSIKLNFKSRKTAKIIEFNLNNLTKEDLFVSSIGKFCLKLRKPNSYDRVSDVDRIVEHLKNYFGENHFHFDLYVIRKIPNTIREADFSVTITLAKPLKKSGIHQVINIQSGDTTDQNYAIAMDIGTTTIYGQLIDLNTGNILYEDGRLNGQISYGEDIISRIIFANTEVGLNEINNILLKTINGIIFNLVKNSKTDIDSISTITFAGNTTMTQLLLKISPKYIRISPYVQASTFYPSIPAIDLGLNLHNHTKALFYPSISSYVGGDIVAGVIGSGMYMSNKLTLFIDIGTNAEVVIGNKDWLLCAACSAGPAFEGGGVEFGIRASPGAIEDFSVNYDTLEPMLVTIEDVSPKGICGSGLITIVAVLFEMGIINNTGKFNRKISTPRIRQRNSSYEYVLSWSNENQINRDIAITEVDIDNLIRTKGAIFSGCMTLLNEVGMSMKNIDQIILAGGFGSYVDLEKAMTIGLLPEIDPEKVIYVGNSSLMGAKMSSLSIDIRQEIMKVVGRMTYCELSEAPSYMDNYIASLFLPHTDIDKFPKLNKRLESIKESKFDEI